MRLFKNILTPITYYLAIHSLMLLMNAYQIIAIIHNFFWKLYSNLTILNLLEMDFLNNFSNVDYFVFIDPINSN